MKAQRLERRAKRQNPSLQYDGEDQIKQFEDILFLTDQQPSEPYYQALYKISDL